MKRFSRKVASGFPDEKQKLSSIKEGHSRLREEQMKFKKIQKGMLGLP